MPDIMTRSDKANEYGAIIDAQNRRMKPGRKKSASKKIENARADRAAGYALARKRREERVKRSRLKAGERRQGQLLARKARREKKAVSAAKSYIKKIGW